MNTPEQAQKQQESEQQRAEQRGNEGPEHDHTGGGGALVTEG
jgi:hypothetical protein